jgi:hypothetical protein
MSGNNQITSVVFDYDTRKLLAGGFSNNIDLLAARFDNDMALDVSFGPPSGYIVVDIGAISRSYGIAIFEDRMILAGSSDAHSFEADFCN